MKFIRNINTLSSLSLAAEQLVRGLSLAAEQAGRPQVTEQSMTVIERGEDGANASTSVKAQQALPRLQAGVWVALEGELGAGKTTFVREVLKALGYSGIAPSPTYPLMIEYELPNLRVIHLDGYRLNPGDEKPWDSAEWSDALVLAEWPDRLDLPLNRYHLHLKFEFDPQTKDRILQIEN